MKKPDKNKPDKYKPDKRKLEKKKLVKKKHPDVKLKMHNRNLHRERYDFPELIAVLPELQSVVSKNVYGDDSVDFFDPLAVRLLNQALLKKYYQIDNWILPEGYLCPPIPGRADYIHHVADIIASSNYGKSPRGEKIRCLDIGVGASCIYPIIGHHEYGWSFVGSEVDLEAIHSANRILEANPDYKEHIEIRHQNNPKDIFYGLIRQDEKYDLSICNPPFHSSAEEALAATQRKLTNLKGEKTDEPVLNFGGQKNELWFEGGESRFIREMIRESKRFGESVFWFSTLISKQSHLKAAEEALKKAGVKDIKIKAMGQGQKSSRILAWTFYNPEEKADWQKSH